MSKEFLINLRGRFILLVGTANDAAVYANVTNNVTQ